MNQEREAVARLIEPHIWSKEVGGYFGRQVEEFREATLAKADQIIALLRSGGEGWRDISTAPKDGTPIRVQTYEVFRWLAYKPDGARQMKRAGRWQKHDGHGFTNCPDPHGVWQAAAAPPPSTQGEG